MNNAKNTTLFPYLERLLEGEEVQWKTLGEVCDYEQPTAYLVRNTNYSDQYPIPVLTAGKTFILGYTNETTGIYRASEHPTIIFDDFTTANKWVDFDFKAKSSAMKMLTSKDEKICLLKYIYYWLNTLPADSIVGDHSRQWISNYAQRLFPLPPLRVQAHIVEILDKFTQLEAELEAELEARKKQYAYYRDQLLNFSQCPPLNVNIEWRTLGEVCENICSGGTPSTKKKQYYQGTIPWLRTQDVDWREVYDTEIKITEEAIANSSAKLIPTNCVIVAMYGATAAKACINKIPLTTNQACCNLQVDEKVAHYKYVYYWISNEYERLKAQGEGSQSNLNARKIKSYKIPLPPLSEQRRIVDILDRFDTLTNSISEGLPKEIALRRKQYEYYRDALLSFPRAEATA